MGININININRSVQITILVLALALLGLAGIYFAVINLEPTEMSIAAIEEGMTGKLVKVAGTIDNIRKTSSNNIYWTVSDGSSAAGMTVPLLDAKFKKIPAMKGDSVEITGLVSDYKGELEIMPKEINVLQQQDQ
jgi:DNA/RNA endonuclease YhcR with UshA esterase domain